MILQTKIYNHEKYIPDMETLLSFKDGIFEVSEGRFVKISGKVNRRVLRDALRRYSRFFDEKINCEAWYSDDIGEDVCGVFCDASNIILIKMDEDSGEESSTLLHELGHLKYQSNFKTLKLPVPFCNLLIEVNPSTRKSLSEIAACYLELKNGKFYFNPEAFDTSNGTYEAANILYKSKIDRRNVWNSLVKAGSLWQVVQNLNGSLKPHERELLLGISKKQPL